MNTRPDSHAEHILPTKTVSRKGAAGPSQSTYHILQYMKQLLIELDDEIAAQLEAVAPSRSRQRSEFIRAAIRRALWEREEQAIEEAYRRQPDSTHAYLDADVWEPRRKRGARGRK